MNNVKTLANKIVVASKNAWNDYTDPAKADAEKSFPMFRKNK